MVRKKLLERKFKPAASAASVVERECLTIPTSLLDGATKTAAISAPVGYGKPTVTAAWRQQLLAQGVRVAWLTLDENAPASLANQNLIEDLTKGKLQIPRRLDSDLSNREIAEATSFPDAH